MKTGKAAEQDRNNKQQGGKKKQGQKNSTEKKKQSKQTPGQHKNGEAKNDKATGKSKNNNNNNKPGDSNTIRPGTPQQAEHGRQMSKEDIKRRKLGKMTRGEATNLLDALKDEEGRLEYIPGQTRKNDQPVSRDW